MSSMVCTTWAAVITLPSAEISTPEPVSVKPIWPPDVTSRPLARITTTDGVTFLKRSRTAWASPTRGAPRTTVPAPIATSIRLATESKRRALFNHGSFLLLPSRSLSAPSSAER